MVGTILLIDPSGRAVSAVRRACDVLGVGMTYSASFDKAEAFLRSGSAELVIGDFESLQRMRTHRPGLHSILLADAVESGQTIDAIRRGSLDCLVAPLFHERVVEQIAAALRLSTEAVPLAEKRSGKTSSVGVRLVGQSPAMQEVYKRIGMIAPRPVNVLITGESGTGKELVARAIHEHSERADKPFVAVHCGAIPETLLESELLGHERGAFTGADRRRIGRFEQCDGGTLFLDEVGDIPLAIQTKLLRVLQEDTFERVGGSQRVTADVRIVAATHQPLEQMVAERRFREDLYYRLKVATIHLPPLREREVDAVLLAHYFVDRMNRQMRTEVRGFAPEAVAALLAYKWPGNVRELENVIRGSLAIARGREFRLAFLPESIRGDVGRTEMGVKSSAMMDARSTQVTRSEPLKTNDPPTFLRQWVAELIDLPSPFAEATAIIHRELIIEALARTQGGLERAAKALGISRTTLRKRMRELGVEVKAEPRKRERDHG